MLDTIKNMTFKNKLKHILEYYKFHIIGIIIIIYCLTLFLNHYIFNPPPKTYVSVTILESPLQFEAIKDLTNILNENLILKDENLKCEILNFHKSDDIQISTAMQTAFIANLQAKNLDIIITSDFKSLLDNGTFAPLDMYLTNDELSKHNLVYDEISKKPIGLILDKSNTLDSAKINYKDMVLGVAINSERAENTSKTLKLLLGL